MKRRPITVNHPAFKGALVCFWLVLFGLLLHRDYFVDTIDIREAAALERDERLEFQGIYFNKEKIGYVESHFLPQKDNSLRLNQEAVMRLNIAGQTHPVELHLEALLQAGSVLQQFSFDFASPFYSMEAQGTVSGSVVSFQLDTGSNSIQDTIRLDKPPMLSTSRRSYLLEHTMSPGEKIRIPWFDPLSLSARETVVEYRGKERTLIHKRVFNLHRYTEVFAGARLNVWLDDEGNVVKEESPAGFVFIKEPEFKAKSLDIGSSDLLASVSVKLSGNMVDLTNRTMMRYRLQLPAEGEFDLDGGRQQFDGRVLTLRLEPVPTAPPPGQATCEGGTGALLSTPYIQSAAAEIIERSLEIISSAENDYDTVRLLADWVYRNLEKRPVIGIPDALTTLHSGVGDCNEHASLFAALARAAGIPTKIAAGVMFNKGAFYYHAWNEVCIGGQWISLDTTTNQLPADLTHLRFIEGDLQEQIRIGSLLNRLQIEPLPD